MYAVLSLQVLKIVDEVSIRPTQLIAYYFCWWGFLTKCCKIDQDPTLMPPLAHNNAHDECFLHLFTCYVLDRVFQLVIDLDLPLV